MKKSATAERTRPAPRAKTPVVRRRLPRKTRQDRIVAQAAQHFAEHGFAASTRALARRMGITQALLYRYFPSKQALIDRVFETTFVDRWDPAWSELLQDRSLPLVQRLSQFYAALLAGISYTSLRLFLRAALDGQDFAAKYTFHLNDRILRPIVGELRHEAGVPGFSRRPLRNGERELVMMLHGSIVFLAIRRHIYGTPLPHDLADYVRLMVETFVAAAPAQIDALQGRAVPDAFRLPIVGRKT